jgi:IS30 family transposase
VNGNGGRRAYRALVADRAARRRARRPKVAKLAACGRLRAVVEMQLAKFWSPEEISAWLARAYPDDAEMRVSHEKIYMSLFVPGRGALRQELHECLRSGRALRQPKTRTKGGFGQGQSVDKGHDLRASRRSCRSGGARPLGRRPDLWPAHELHRHAR